MVNTIPSNTKETLEAIKTGKLSIASPMARAPGSVATACAASCAGWQTVAWWPRGESVCWARAGR